MLKYARLYFYLIRNYWCFVDNDVKKSNDVCSISKVQQQRCVTVDKTSLRKHLNCQSYFNRRYLRQIGIWL